MIENQSNLCRRVPPEDLHPGMFIVVLSVMHEMLAPGSTDDPALRTPRMLRIACTRDCSRGNGVKKRDRRAKTDTSASPGCPDTADREWPYSSGPASSRYLISSSRCRAQPYRYHDTRPIISNGPQRAHHGS
jgi:hypothetical protein